MRLRLDGLIRKMAHILRSRAVAAPLIGALAVFLFTNLMSSQRFFVILDGDTFTVHESYADTAARALSEAGVQVSRADYISLPLPNKQSRVTEIVISRGEYATILADGKTIRVSIDDRESVGGLLERSGVKLGPLDEVSHRLQDLAQDNMIISVTRVSVRTVYEPELIPFETIRQGNPELPFGEERLVQTGADGQAQLLYEVRARDSAEVSRRFVERIVLSEPRPEIFEYGTQGAFETPDGTLLRYTQRLDVTATAYTTEGKKNKVTALGTIARVGAIAVDPKVIPLRSKVYVQAPNGEWIYGIAVCEDTGGVIKGNKIDLFFDTRAECTKFGVRKAVVYVLTEE